MTNWILYCCSTVTKSCLTLLWPPWIVVHQAPLFMGFPRQEYWSGLPFPSPGGVSDPGIHISCISSQRLTTESPGNPTFMYFTSNAKAGWSGKGSLGLYKLKEACAAVPPRPVRAAGAPSHHPLSRGGLGKGVKGKKIYLLSKEDILGLIEECRHSWLREWMHNFCCKTSKRALSASPEQRPSALLLSSRSQRCVAFWPKSQCPLTLGACCHQQEGDVTTLCTWLSWALGAGSDHRLPSEERLLWRENEWWGPGTLRVTSSFERTGSGPARHPLTWGADPQAGQRSQEHRLCGQIPVLSLSGCVTSRKFIRSSETSVSSSIKQGDPSTLVGSLGGLNQPMCVHRAHGKQHRVPAVVTLVWGDVFGRLL